MLLYIYTHATKGQYNGISSITTYSTYALTTYSTYALTTYMLHLNIYDYYSTYTYDKLVPL